MTRTGEKGIALVFTLFLMAALSAMAVSMMFLAQTETSASRNYKTMSQARYAGEAGVHRVIHYLSSTAYTDLVTSTAGFDVTVSPVTYDGQPVKLTTVDPCPTGPPTPPPGTCSNHPSTAIKAAYAALFTNNSLSLGNGATVTYEATATLVSMRSVNIYGGTTGIVQTWRIDATGTVPGTLAATVQVGALLERDAAPAEMYAIFATGEVCGAVNLSGNLDTDSYDSRNITLSSGQPVTQPSGGAVGTNGNLRIGGQVTVNGNLDTPRTGVGNCINGNPTALEQTGQATITGDIIRLPQPKLYPDPAPLSTTPDPTQTVSVQATSFCSAFQLTSPASCFKDLITGIFTIAQNGPNPITLGNVALSGGAKILITSGSGGHPVVLNVNSWSMSGNSSMALATSSTATMNVAGAGITGTVVDFTGGTFTNSTFDPSRLQILYGGTGTLKLTGGSGAAATVYAPNADITMSGNADFYGSILGKTFSDSSGASVHYDKALASKYFVLGNHVMSSFSWQKY